MAFRSGGGQSVKKLTPEELADIAWGCIMYRKLHDMSQKMLAKIIGFRSGGQLLISRVERQNKPSHAAARRIR